MVPAILPSDYLRHVLGFSDEETNNILQIAGKPPRKESVTRRLTREDRVVASHQSEKTTPQSSGRDKPPRSPSGGGRDGDGGKGDRPKRRKSGSGLFWYVFFCCLVVVGIWFACAMNDADDRLKKELGTSRQLDNTSLKQYDLEMENLLRRGKKKP